MQILKAIHDELVALRNRIHDLVEPEKSISDKVHAWIDEAMAHLHGLEARFAALEARVKQAEAALVGDAPKAAEAVPPESAPSSSDPEATGGLASLEGKAVTVIADGSA